MIGDFPKEKVKWYPRSDESKLVGIYGGYINKYDADAHNLHDNLESFVIYNHQTSNRMLFSFDKRVRSGTKYTNKNVMFDGDYENIDIYVGK
jgi:hypothetical protein